MNRTLLPAAVVHELYSEFLLLRSRLNLIRVCPTILECEILGLDFALTFNAIIEDDECRSFNCIDRYLIETCLSILLQLLTWPLA